MAAAQVAKKLKDKRQQRTIEGIFKKVIDNLKIDSSDLYFVCIVCIWFSSTYFVNSLSKQIWHLLRNPQNAEVDI